MLALAAQAPVRMTVSIVTWLIMATMLLNQDVSPLGLKALRTTSLTGIIGF